MLITDVPKELGYSVIEADDGVTGPKILQSDMRIDLVVTDVGLPGGINGRQMVDAAQVFSRDLKVLSIIGYAESTVLGSGDLAPGMVVLVKPRFSL
jgi:CheY-like chemotaxis protein